MWFCFHMNISNSTTIRQARRGRNMVNAGEIEQILKPNTAKVLFLEVT